MVPIKSFLLRILLGLCCILSLFNSQCMEGTKKPKASTSTSTSKSKKKKKKKWNKKPKKKKTKIEFSKKVKNALCFKVSGNGLKKSSYLYGVLGTLERNDFKVADSVEEIIKNCDTFLTDYSSEDYTKVAKALWNAIKKEAKKNQKRYRPESLKLFEDFSKKITKLIKSDPDGYLDDSIFGSAYLEDPVFHGRELYKIFKKSHPDARAEFLDRVNFVDDEEEFYAIGDNGETNMSLAPQAVHKSLFYKDPKSGRKVNAVHNIMNAASGVGYYKKLLEKYNRADINSLAKY